MAIPTPAIPSFTDGQLLAASPLNAVASNITNLYNSNHGFVNSQRPAALIKQTTAQTINNTVDTLVNFQTASINTDNMYVPSQPTQLTIQHTGIYFVFGQVRYPGIAAPTTSTIMGATLLANGTSVANGISVMGALMSTATLGGFTGTMISLAAGGTLYLDLWQNSGGPITLATDSGGTFLGAVFLTSST